MKKSPLNNKVVLITGGSSGIGRALALRFGKEGADIVFTGQDAGRIKETEQLLTEQNITHHAITMDVSIEEDNKRMIEETIQTYGKLNVFIANAGIGMSSLFEDFSLESFDKMMAVNFQSVVYGTYYALPYISNTKGSLVGISSVAGKRGVPGRTAYSASKFAMQGFYESLRVELMERNVHILMACPGYTESNIRKRALSSDKTAKSAVKEGKFSTAESVAESIFQATVSKKRDLVLTRQGRMVNMLNKIVPSFVDKRILKFFKKQEPILGKRLCQLTSAYRHLQPVNKKSSITKEKV